MNNIPKGYKQTEAGVIPEDWVVKKLGEIAPLQRGFDLPKNQLQAGNYPVVYSNGIDNFHSEYKAKAPGVVTGRSGTLGKVTYVNENYWPHNTSLWVTDFRENYPLFIYYLYLHIKLERFGTGSGVPTLNRNDVHDFKVAIPNRTEQAVIAAALSNADAVISSQEKLIAKKRNIKQGAMQELLTGKKRLQGFMGMWEVNKLGEVAPMQRGFDLPKTRLQEGKYPVVYSNGIDNFHSEYKAKAPGVVTGRSGTLGKVTYVNENYWPHNTSLWVTDFRENYPLFIYYLYLHIKLERFGTGSGVPTLNRNDVHDFKVAIPNRIEQAAIAQVLNDMDAEIEQLEKKLAKYRMIKQGMMQELLTGKIRLI